ncbi:unnamed protein product [Symbiodinium natans]|uniref:HMG box domain-containing protein n=1 Tax=Symbiodinium natans TaxID=878477 RepID=A0A812NXA5_9DINO|nr:unnamed protein product [Symbiodinium natans]
MERRVEREAWHHTTGMKFVRGGTSAALAHVHSVRPAHVRRPVLPLAELHVADLLSFQRPQRASAPARPTFAEICKAIPEKWKAVDEAQKAFYEQKAKIAKEQLALEPAEAEVPKAKKADAKKAPGKKGKGKGKGKQKAEDPVMTKAEFFRDCPVLRCALQIPSGSAQASEALAPPMDLVARTFKSGGVGMFSSVKFDLPVGPQQVTVTAQVVMNVSGSKYWEDGEGYEAALKSLESRAQEVSVALRLYNTVEHPFVSKAASIPWRTFAGQKRAWSWSRQHPLAHFRGPKARLELEIPAFRMPGAKVSVALWLNNAVEHPFVSKAASILWRTFVGQKILRLWVKRSTHGIC